MNPDHWAIFISNASPVDAFIDDLLRKDPPKVLDSLALKSGGLFSQKAVDRFIEEEVRHDLHLLNPDTNQQLRTFSSGERKKALLNYLLDQELQFLILHNPFDNLDTASRSYLLKQLEELSDRINMVQIVSRPADLLPFINHFARLHKEGLEILESAPESNGKTEHRFSEAIPAPLEKRTYEAPYLVQMKDVTISYGQKIVVRGIHWEIKPGEFWQLAGPNGSGKTTLLSLITGDNPKAYGQDIYLFGYQKGSGESVWDIKEEIGYFTPAMTDRFRGNHSLEHMLISGLVDSIGLYVQPTEQQQFLAQEWLKLLGMEHQAQKTFDSLSPGEKRLIMCARAMIKHPLLLILDEPTAGLDDTSAAMVVDLVNKMASHSKSAIIFVSHRIEPGLMPDLTLQLLTSDSGSKAEILYK